MFKKFFQARAERRKQLELERIEERNRFQDRLLNPDFEMVTKRFGAPASLALREFYADDSVILRQHVEWRPDGAKEDECVYACWFIPLDDEAIEKQWHKDDGLFDFADDGSGNRYTIDPTDEDAEIQYFEHDDGSLHPTGIKFRDLRALEEF